MAYIRHIFTSPESQTVKKLRVDNNNHASFVIRPTLGGNNIIISS